MKKQLFWMFIFTLLAGIAFADETPPAPLTIAVYDFHADPDAKSYGSKVTALVTADLSTATNLIMVERAELNKAIQEQAFGVSGLVSSDAAARVGQITGAKVLISGEVMKLKGNHLVIIGNIIGTETARLFAVKVEGPDDRLTDLTSELSAKAAQMIQDQATNLVRPGVETSAARLDRIIKNLHGTNRPTVSVFFHFPRGPKWPSATPVTEMQAVLQKAGFTVVDANSERKPDVMITGVVDIGGNVRGGLHTQHAIIEMKAQERRTGLIISVDRQESVATESSQMGAQRAAQALAVDGLAERLLPLLVK